jgi:hypothetical protein
MPQGMHDGWVTASAELAAVGVALTAIAAARSATRSPAASGMARPLEISNFNARDYGVPFWNGW